MNESKPCPKYFRGLNNMSRFTIPARVNVASCVPILGVLGVLTVMNLLHSPSPLLRTGVQRDLATTSSQAAGTPHLPPRLQPAELGEPSGLPEGWRAFTHPSSKNVHYYHNYKSGETTWTKPSNVPPMRAVPPPAPPPAPPTQPVQPPAVPQPPAQKTTTATASPPSKKGARSCPDGTFAYHHGSHCCKTSRDLSGGAIHYGSANCELQRHIPCPYGTKDGSCDPETSYPGIGQLPDAITGTAWPAPTYPTVTPAGLTAVKLTPEVIEAHFRFSEGRYEHEILKLPPLDYIFQWKTVPGRVQNPGRPDSSTGESSVVEDARFILPPIRARCPERMALNSASVKRLFHVTDTARLPKSDHANRGKVSPVRLDPVSDFDVLSVTHFTHDLDYLIPRMPDEYGDPKGQLCMKRDIERFIACQPSYASDHRVLGINQPCAFYHYVARAQCMFIDMGSGHSAVTGRLYNNTHLLKKTFFDRMGIDARGPAPAIVHERVILALGTYAATNSHFLIEVLPGLLYTLEVLGKDFPATILHLKKGVVSQILALLGKKGVLDPSKLMVVDTPPTQPHYAKEVFFAEHFPGSCLTDSHNYGGPETSGRVRRVMATPFAPVSQRNKVLLINRKGSRSIANEAALFAALKGVVLEPYELKIYDWKNYADMEAIIEEFKRAAVVIGVHGAGLANILFAPQCTTVIELMWKGDYLNTPTAFYSHSTALRHDYWMVLDNGSYGGSMAVNIPKMTGIVKQVLGEKREALATGGSAPVGYCVQKSFTRRNREYIKENTKTATFTRCSARPKQFDRIPE